MAEHFFGTKNGRVFMALDALVKPAELGPTANAANARHSKHSRIRNRARSNVLSLVRLAKHERVCMFRTFLARETGLEQCMKEMRETNGKKTAE